MLGLCVEAYNRWALSGLGSISVISKSLAKEQAAQDECKVWSSL